MEQQVSYESTSKKPSEKGNENLMEEERDFLDMEEFYRRNIFLSDKKAENIGSKEDVEVLNPGPFSYGWLDEEGSGERFMEHSYEQIDLSDMRALDLNVEVNRLYMVKWKNLSYSEATWELETVVSCPDKILEFKNNNKALGKEARTLMDSQR
jgi:hypothetical protein